MSAGVLNHVRESRRPAAEPRPGEAPPALGKRTLFRLTLALVALGVACRALRYLLQFPFWGDESFLCLNFVGRDYLGLTRQLDCNQVAPVLFLWGEFTAYRLLGTSELALRLLPFLAALGGLALFWHLARCTVSPRAALLAVGMLAVARWPVTMGAVVKPYSFDLLFALALLVPAVHWLRRPERVGWLALLAALTPPALAASYPAVFVAGAVSLALLPAVWRGRGPAVLTLYLTYNLLMAGTFLACYLLVGREQLDPATGSVNTVLQNYWADGFPPAEPWPLLRWFALINTGRLFAYPVGDSNGGSVLTFLLFVAGVWRFWKQGRRELLVLWLTPFALNLLAAALRRYPYGGCCRLSQHVAPAICLLAGVGAAAVLERLAPTAAGRLRWVAVICTLLGICGAAQMVLDVAQPYRDAEGLWSRKVARELDELAEPGDQVVVAEPTDVWPVLRWQLHRLGGRVSWGDAVDWERVGAKDGRVWLLTPWRDDLPPEEDKLPGDPARRGAWVMLDRTTYSLRRTKTGDPNERCTLSCWVRQDGGKRAKPVFSSWP